MSRKLALLTCFSFLLIWHSECKPVGSITIRSDQSNPSSRRQGTPVHHLINKRQDEEVEPSPSPATGTTEANATVSGIISGLKTVESSVATIATSRFAADVCGSPANGKVASVTRSKATWEQYGMSTYKTSTVQKYQSTGNWQGVTDIQTIFLIEAGNEGVGKCDEIINPRCVETGADFELCNQHPDAQSAWFAINNLELLTALASDTVKQFYTTRANPERLIVPFAIVGGIMGMIPVFFSPAGFAAGGAALINGILTQAALDTPNPLEQWQAVLSVLGNLFKQVETVLEKFFNANLHTLPAPNLPAILATGDFATTPTVGAFNQGVQAASGSVAINALWLLDKVLIIKISAEAYNQGAGAACKAFPIQTVCVGGNVANIFVRWSLNSGINTVGDVAPTQGKIPPNGLKYERGPSFDKSQWNVFGAYALGTAGDGTANADHLKDYGLDMSKILASAEKTQAARGFLYKDQNKDTLDTLRGYPMDLRPEQLTAWKISICDVDAALKLRGKSRLKKPRGTAEGVPEGEMDPVALWGVPTCMLLEGWPSEEYGWKNGNWKGQWIEQSFAPNAWE